MTSINPIFYVNHVQAPNFKAAAKNTATITNPIEQTASVTLNGTDALAAYNYNLVNRNNDFNIPVIEPIERPDDITKVGGTPIYNSKGQVVIVEKIEGDKKYIYHNDEEKRIEVFNKNNELVKEQFYNDILNKTWVKEFHGNNNYLSLYNNEGDQLEIQSKEKWIKENGKTTKSYLYNYEKKEYQVSEGPNLHAPHSPEKILVYDENHRLKSIIQESSNKTVSQDFSYKNGILYSTTTYETNVIKNDLAKYFTDDPDLKQFAKTEVPENPESLNGEKTYYSNGKIESNTVTENGKTKSYYFNLNGDLEKIVDGNKTTHIQKYCQEIIETNGDEVIVTGYEGDGSISLSYEKGDLRKFANYVDGKIMSYTYEKGDDYKNYKFSKDGNLLDLYEGLDL